MPRPIIAAKSSQVPRKRSLAEALGESGRRDIERHRGDLVWGITARFALSLKKDAKRHTDRADRKRLIKDLDDDHFEKVIGSGLNAETINAAQLYSEHDTGNLCEKLNGSFATAPALMFPFFNQHGVRIEHTVARPSDSRPAKYVQPKDKECCAYFPPLRIVRKALNKPGESLLITEGILKALAATQAGVPCIGLMGVWNWLIKITRDDGTVERVLIKDLARIDWKNRIVVIAFDFDTKRKPNVRYAEAELARVLTELGANVVILKLPPGPIDLETGTPEKTGLDDFIVRVGEECFREWGRDQLTPPSVRQLDEWRSEMRDQRQASLNKPGISLDRGPTGVGKSYIDGDILERLGEERTLSLQPTHFNCRQVEKEFSGRGIEAAPYPQLTAETCARFDETSALQKQGLIFQKVLCGECEHADECPYLEGYSRAKESQHTIATHKRGEVMPGLWKDRQYISIHENPLAIFRPRLAATKGLEAVELIAMDSLKHCSDDDSRSYFCRMRDVAKLLQAFLEGASETKDIPLPNAAQKFPENPDLDLYHAIERLRVHPIGETLQLVRAVTNGMVDHLWVKIEDRWQPASPGESPTTKSVRSLFGVLRTELPTGATVWINDATADPQLVAAVIGRPIEDRTPKGSIARKQSVLQIPMDVSRRTTVSVAARTLRGILHDLPQSRVGVITHKPLIEKGLRKDLGKKYSKKIAMLEYFGGGQSRGSNEWIEKCDVLVVLGTPRIPPQGIQNRLIQLGMGVSAKISDDEAGWCKDYWSGKLATGQRKTVKTLHYKNHDWHSAYCDMVVAELKQAIGRARPILVKGIPVYLVTTEELGEVIAGDTEFLPLTKPQTRILASFGNRRGVRKMPSEISKELKVTPKQVRVTLSQLEKAGRVQRIGQRGGWLIPVRSS